MRPQLLEFSAMGSYPGDVSIDFDQLSPHGLFHIHGPTGAGKSSLLDAMCFALYGTVPGARRADGLRSQHASPSTEARVSFAFNAQDVDWKIIRVPAQERAKLRGNGTTRQLSKASLYRRNGSEWVPIGSHTKEVDLKVRELVGLDADQFMQVVMLPQGAVQEALRASAEKRRELLSTLFQTSRFSYYSEHLSNRAKFLQAALDVQASKARGIVSQITDRAKDVGIEFDWPQTPTFALDDQERVCIARIGEEVLDRDTSARHQVALERETHQQLDEQFRLASLQAKDARRLQAAEEKLALLLAQQDQIAQARQTLAAVASSAPAWLLLQRLDSQFAVIERLNKQREHHIRLLSEERPLPDIAQPIRDALGLAGDAGFIGDDMRKAQLTSRGVLADFSALLERFGQVSALQSTIAGLSVEVDNATKHGLTTERRLATTVAKIDACQQQEAALVVIASNAEDLQQRVESLSAQHGAARELQTLEHEREVLSASALTADKHALDLQSRHLELFESYLNGVASELARDLSEGSPCSVCGATEHPAPAPSIDEQVSRDDVDQAAAQFRNAQNLARTAHELLDERNAALQQVAGAAGPLGMDLGKLEHELHQAQQHLAAAIDADHQLQLLRGRLKTLNESLVSQQTNLDQAKSTAIKAQTSLDLANQQLSQLQAELDALVGPDCNLTATHGFLQTVSEAIDAVIRLSSEVGNVESQVSNDQRKLQELLNEAGLASADDLRLLQSDRVDAQALRGLVDAYQASLRSTQETIDELSGQPSCSLEELNDLEEQTKAAHQRLQDAVVQHARTTEAAQKIAELEASYLVQYQSIGPAQRECDRVTQLADLCAGVRTNDKRMSLERYVLAAYLEEIAAAASSRLLVMTSGRYSLRHDDSRVRGNAASGLSLLVCDAYTGQEREVNTLSGGETFLASLAFALGIADVVQRHAGGVKIEALFIDEGFGSLDSETLDFAMAELDRLREGGRLVGVISHVDSLRERIPAGIEVIAASTGSRVVVRC